jgi:hypothetical protein
MVTDYRDLVTSLALGYAGWSSRCRSRNWFRLVVSLGMMCMG